MVLEAGSWKQIDRIPLDIGPRHFATTTAQAQPPSTLRPGDKLAFINIRDSFWRPTCTCVGSCGNGIAQFGSLLASLHLRRLRWTVPEAVLDAAEPRIQQLRSEGTEYICSAVLFALPLTPSPCLNSYATGSGTLQLINGTAAWRVIDELVCRCRCPPPANFRNAHGFVAQHRYRAVVQIYYVHTFAACRPTW